MANLAGTNPDDINACPTGDTENGGMDDGWEWKNFETLAQLPYDDIDSDGSFNIDGFT